MDLAFAGNLHQHLPKQADSPSAASKKFSLISGANRANVSIYAIDLNGLTTASSQQAEAAIISSLQTAPSGGVENVASSPSLVADENLQ